VSDAELSDAEKRRDRAVGLWVPCLISPLVPLAQRVQAESELANLAGESPSWAALLWGGLIAELACTLPAADPWRDCSARAGGATVGGFPPSADGAVLADGQPLGHFRDFAAAGLELEPVLDDCVEEDLDLAPVATPLDQQAAALIAFGFDGWRAGVAAAGHFAGLHGGARFARSGIDAFRWVAFRRQVWKRGLPDPYPPSSVLMWNARSGRADFGSAADDAMVTEDILAHRLVRRD
jgi:hypothetical protein